MLSCQIQGTLLVSEIQNLVTHKGKKIIHSDYLLFSWSKSKRLEQDFKRKARSTTWLEKENQREEKDAQEPVIGSFVQLKLIDIII